MKHSSAALLVTLLIPMCCFAKGQTEQKQPPVTPTPPPPVSPAPKKQTMGPQETDGQPPVGADPVKTSGGAGNDPKQDPASNPSSGQTPPPSTTKTPQPKKPGPIKSDPGKKQEGKDHKKETPRRENPAKSSKPVAPDVPKPVDAVIRRPQTPQSTSPLPWVFLGATIVVFFGALFYAAASWRKARAHHSPSPRHFSSSESDVQYSPAPVRIPEERRKSPAPAAPISAEAAGPAEKLRVISSKSVETLPLSPSRPVMSIGSLSSMDIVLVGEHVLPHHASVEKAGDGWTIKGTTGPIVVNGDEVTACRLQRGQVIEIGSCRIQVLSRGD